MMAVFDARVPDPQLLLSADSESMTPSMPSLLPCHLHLQVVQADTRVLDIPSVQQAVERALQVRVGAGGSRVC